MANPDHFAALGRLGRIKRSSAWPSVRILRILRILRRAVSPGYGAEVSHFASLVR